MALNLASLSSALAPNASLGFGSLQPNSAVKLAQLARSNPMHYTASGAAGIVNGRLGEDEGGIPAEGVAAKAPSFQDALLKAMDGVSASQNKSDDMLQRVVADPDSVDAQDVTISMAEANMSLNLAKTILSRIVTAWKDVINTR
jgi:flagellar hook-basal body complex protein FliE